MESRTFGMKRVQFMLMPLMYKMGVMMTMLTVLTAISVKGLFIGEPRYFRAVVKSVTGTNV